jgi:PAS domain S-box-containing protein
MKNFSLRSALIYLAIGLAWIFGSDWLVNNFSNTEVRAFLQSVKGILFVFVTALVLFIILQRSLILLRKKETEFRSLFIEHPQPLWVYDTATLKFMAVNDAAIKKYGYSRNEFLQLTMLDIRPVEERETIRQFLMQAEKEDYVSDKIHLHMNKAGKLFYTRTSSHKTSFEGRPARMVMALDAMAEKEAERKLTVSEKKLETLLNNSDDIIWLFDDQGTVATYNHAFRKKFKNIMGIEMPANIRLNMSSLTGTDLTQKWQHYFHEAMHGVHQRIEESFYSIEQDRKEFFEIVLSPIYDDKQSLIGVGCFARDITSRKQTEAEINDKVKTLKEIAWIQSHAVRRPLANIMGLAELIKLNTSNTEQVEEAVTLMERSCKELDEIIREVVRKSGTVK